MFDPEKLLQQRRLQHVKMTVNARLQETKQLEQALMDKLGMSHEQFKRRCQQERDKGKTMKPEVKKLVSKVLDKPNTTDAVSKPKKMPKHIQFI